ncbi:MAG: ribosome maturation factor RimM [Candidatus Zixiibacteriota bacterium]
MTDPDALITIGTLGKTRGVHGELYVTPTSDTPERFLELKELFVEFRGEWKRMTIASARIVSGRPVLKLAGIDTPEEAARLTNRQLALPRGQLMELAEDTFFVFELVGCKVYADESGDYVGEITQIEECPSSDVYVIAAEDGREWLCPAVKQFVRSVDIENRKVVVVTTGLAEQA